MQPFSLYLKSLQFKCHLSFDPQPCKNYSISKKILFSVKKKFLEIVKNIICVMKSMNYASKKEHDSSFCHHKLATVKMQTKLLDDYSKLVQTSTTVKNPDRTKLERKIAEKNSLFLTNKSNLSVQDKVEILRIGSNIYKAADNSPSKFIEYPVGSCKPILHKKYQVFYKRMKHPNIDIHAALIRKEMEEECLDDLILPTREFWRNKKDKTHVVYIENAIRVVGDYLTLQMHYKKYPLRFTKTIVALTRLFCKIEIGDTCVDDRRHTNTMNRINERFPECNDKVLEECRCNFDNLSAQQWTNEKGEKFYKFVLVDLDSVRKPDHTTANNLFRMFPLHKNIIKQTILENNPELLNVKIDPNTVREDLISPGPESEELLEDYKNKEKERLDLLESEGKLEAYRKEIRERDIDVAVDADSILD